MVIFLLSESKTALYQEHKRAGKTLLQQQDACWLRKTKARLIVTQPQLLILWQINPDFPQSSIKSKYHFKDSCNGASFGELSWRSRCFIRSPSVGYVVLACRARSGESPPHGCTEEINKSIYWTALQSYHKHWSTLHDTSSANACFSTNKTQRQEEDEVFVLWSFTAFNTHKDFFTYINKSPVFHFKITNHRSEHVINGGKKNMFFLGNPLVNWSGTPELN